jgi:hypothetical protein
MDEYEKELQKKSHMITVFSEEENEENKKNKQQQTQQHSL